MCYCSSLHPSIWYKATPQKTLAEWRKEAGAQSKTCQRHTGNTVQRLCVVPTEAAGFSQATINQITGKALKKKLLFKEHPTARAWGPHQWVWAKNEGDALVYVSAAVLPEEKEWPAFLTPGKQWKSPSLSWESHEPGVNHWETHTNFSSVQFSCSVMSNSLWPHELQHPRPPLSITSSRSLLKLMSIESVMPSNHLILCRLLLLPPSLFPSIRVFSNESVLRIRWPKYWSFSFSISPSNEYSGLISFRMDWLDLLAVQRKSQEFLQHHSSKHQLTEVNS